MRYSCLAFSILALIVFTTCGKDKGTALDPEALKKNKLLNTSHQTYSLQDFYQYDSRVAALTDSIFNTLTDQERVSQMIISSIGDLGHSLGEAKALVKNKKVGGFVSLNDTKENHKKAIEALNLTAKENHVPGLLFSADAEPSLLNSRIKGTQILINTNEIETVSESDSIAKLICKELKELGVHQNYAPVLDVGSNNSAIKNRSFGSDPDQVIALSQAFIKSTQEENIAATVKHFPGHGLVVGDTHFDLVSIDGDLQELNNYKPMIDFGVISIMVGHLSITNNPKYDTYGVPASCSRKIVTGLLKNELNFKGIIISDGMKMKALEQIPNATLEVSKAGCDIILIPEDEDETSELILNEMKTDTAYRNQVYESVKKLIRLKICLGIM